MASFRGTFIWLCLGTAVHAGAVDVHEAVLLCDRTFCIPTEETSYRTAVRCARQIRDAGITRGDTELEARGLARLSFAEIRFGRWSEGWDEPMKRALVITDQSSLNLGRAEVLLLDGYLKAMYLRQMPQGIEQLKQAVVVGRSLQNDRILAHAFRYLASLSSVTGDNHTSLELYQRSVLFARRAGDEPVEFISRKQLLVRQIRDRIPVDEANRNRVRELGVRLAGEEPLLAMSRSSC